MTLPVKSLWKSLKVGACTRTMWAVSAPENQLIHNFILSLNSLCLKISILLYSFIPLHHNSHPLLMLSGKNFRFLFGWNFFRLTIKTFFSSVSWRYQWRNLSISKLWNKIGIESKCPWRSHSVRNALPLLLECTLSLYDTQTALCVATIKFRAIETRNILSYSRLRSIIKNGQWTGS